MPLFIELAEGVALDQELIETLNSGIRAKTTARHVPDEIVVVPGIPVSHANKRLEVPIKRLFLGFTPEQALNIGSVANPETLKWFIDRAKKICQRPIGPQKVTGVPRSNIY